MRQGQTMWLSDDRHFEMSCSHEVLLQTLLSVIKLSMVEVLLRLVILPTVMWLSDI